MKVLTDEDYKSFCEQEGSLITIFTDNDIYRCSFNSEDPTAIINGQRTYRFLSVVLKECRSIFIAWSDEDMSRYDVLLSINPQSIGMHGSGLRKTDLFVSVMGIGCFGFERLERDGKLHGGYIGEKLKLSGDCEKLAELLNGIIFYEQPPIE